MVDDDDIDVQKLQLTNSTNGNTFTTRITGLDAMSCHIFGVRAYTDRGPGGWVFIANEILISTQFVTLTTCTQEVRSTSTVSGAVDGASIGLGAVVGLLLISLAVSIIIHIYCFIKLKTYDTTTAKQTKFDDDIPMQACEPYGIHKTKDVTKDAVYECPDVNVNDTAIYEET
ncbi:PREDICTED: uncharacterized protein LOC109585217 [Amphimedon queenslandica]|uniref:Fibronectin type-III domain-containing protein n=1 Tax=Amphimedon queenslandica TaxID=400682 RepID=A0AAN0JJ35_AMPQE|nr:PREDICTED: uncharacterized protein LOC109585217 [Amphimedon queenslandica]|eukprot:XP_019856772.1 PREDICTED: uncharacterized protein LOC109585217 [Amphimedon queenslandica]